MLKLEMLFIGIALFGLVFVVGLEIYSEGLSVYNPDIDTSTTFGKMSSNIKTITEEQDTIKGKIRTNPVSDENAVDEMIGGGYKGIRNSPFDTLEIATNATETLLLETNVVSSSIINFLVLSLSVLVIFSIIYLIFRWSPK